MAGSEAVNVISLCQKSCYDTVSDQRLGVVEINRLPSDSQNVLFFLVAPSSSKQQESPFMMRYLCGIVHR